MRMLDPTIRWMAMALALAPNYAADCCKNSAAVVFSLSGSATVRLPGNPTKVAVSGLDWLSDGATLEVGTGSRVVLILSNGRRFELGQGAKATLMANAAPKITGVVRELPALPPIPKPVAVVADSAPTSGAVRVRGGEAISDSLYPRAGMVALPDKVSLRFKAVPNATSYRVTLENDGGDILLNVTTESTEVAVPAGTIAAGEHYSWRVRAFSSGSEIAVGTAELTTLSAWNALQRAEFASALGAADNDPATLALLAGVDLRLGLVAEACSEFGAAVKQRPDHAAWQRALAACESSRNGR
jgi:hypothetical protein